MACLACQAPAALIGYYSFDAASGADGSAFGNNATMGGSITFPADRPFGTGLSGQTTTGGTAARVMTVPTSPSLESLDDRMTVSFWMKSNLADNGNWIRIFQHGTEAGGTRTWLIDRNSSNNYTNMRVDTLPASGGVFNQNIANGGPNTFDGQWHHLIYTIDNGLWRKYVDATSLNGTYSHGDGVSNDRPLYIFGRNGTGEYVGLLDDIAIWDVALTDGQAKALRNLALEPSLAYGAGEANRLFDLYAAGTGSVRIGDALWVPATDLGGPVGSIGSVGGSLLAVKLGADGSGLMMVPEPATMLMLGLAAGSVGGYLRRRRG